METRKYSLDVYKILAMFLIVLGHILIYRENGILLASNNVTPINYPGDYISIILLGLSIVGVNSFFLITGYFGTKLKLVKIIDLVLVVFFWGGAIQVALLLLGRISLSVFAHTMLLLIDRYWFIEVYIALLLVTPLLNTFLDNYDFKRKSIVVILYGIGLCTYAFVHDCSRIGASGGFSLVWASFLYMAGNLIRDIVTMQRDYKKRKLMAIVLYICSTCIYIIGCIVILAFNRYDTFWKFAVSYNNPFVLVSSLSLLYLFAIKDNWPSKGRKVIVFFSSTTIGVYLIHTAPNLELFKFFDIPLSSALNSFIFVIMCILGTICIYLVCSIGDYFRQKTLSKIIVPFLNKIIKFNIG